ncbi:MAG: tetratricopeptide repeat protein [Candidatus Obscuribacter sp.]|jgi:hypothetical protein|nr:tetratricopeptide repeat protein [Candidatus Obscuribacter sp.]
MNDFGWSNLLQQLQTISPEIVLQPGASSAQIAELEQHIGVKPGLFGFGKFAILALVCCGNVGLMLDFNHHHLQILPPAYANDNSGWADDNVHTMPPLRQKKLEPLLERARFASEPEFTRLVQDAKKQERDGNKTLAKEQYDRALEQSGFTSWSNPKVVKIISHLELLCQSLGQKSEEERYRKKLSAIAEAESMQIAVISPLAPEEIECRLQLADTLSYDDKITQAERFYLCGFCSPLDSPQTSLYLRALTAERLVRLHTKSGELQKAAEEIENSFKNIEAIYQANPSDTNARALLCVMSGKICLLNAEGKSNEAADLSRKCTALLAKTPSASSIRQLWVYADKARTQALQKDYVGAIASYSRALATSQNHALSYIYVNPVKLALADCYRQSGATDKAEQLMKELKLNE